MDAIPDAVRNKALTAGAEHWLEVVPKLIATLEHRWNIVVGRPFGDSTEAYVAEATRADGSDAVVKLMLPPRR